MTGGGLMENNVRVLETLILVELEEEKEVEEEEASMKQTTMLWLIKWGSITIVLQQNSHRTI